MFDVPCLAAFFAPLLTLGVTAAQAPPVQGVVVERRAWVMGTELALKLVAPDETTGQRIAEAALAAVRQADDVLSTWRDDTELARLNRAPVGVGFALSPGLNGWLTEVWRWWRDSGGTFDPGVGPLVDAWGVRDTLRTPSPDALARARAQSGLSRFAFDSARGTVVRRARGAWIDSGGFGKGAALREVKAVLRRAGVGAALVNFGGQGLALGSSPDAAAGDRGGWTIGVAHPAKRFVPVRTLVVRDRSVSTSGQSEQPGHILDPRTGRPVPAWGSVTVVARDPMVADILSTALFVMGPEDGLRWARNRQDFGALFLILHDGQVAARWNSAMEPYFKKEQK